MHEILCNDCCRDQRNLKKALWVTGGLLNYHDNTCVRIGPTERHVATGTSALKDGDHGDLVFLNAEVTALWQESVGDSTWVSRNRKQVC